MPAQNLSDLQRAVSQGHARAASLASEAIARLEAIQDKTRATRTLTADRAQRTANQVDQLVSDGADPGPLAGVPVVVKDNILVEGESITAGSQILEAYRAAYDADVVRRLENAGATIVGIANMDEFGMGSSTERCAWGAVANPWGLDRVPGGSSGGSAAAVAAGAVEVALGSDTGGSVRQPAAFCGIVGLKPSYGAVSRHGLVAYASSMDQIGPFGRTVADVERVFRVIAGRDPRDATSKARPTDATSSIRRVGVPAEYFPDSLDPDIRRALDDAKQALQTAGIELVPVSLPSTDLALSCYYIIAPAEASSNLSRFDGMRYGNRSDGKDFASAIGRTRTAGFGPEVQRRILVGTFVLTAGHADAYYHQAQRVRASIRHEFAQVFEQVDALLTPTAPTVAFEMGSRPDPISMLLGDTFTVPPSLAGLAAVSVPCGRASGLPVGAQLVAPSGQEQVCLDLARHIEAALSPEVGRPPLWVGPS